MSLTTEVRTFSDICKAAACRKKRHFTNGYCRKHYAYNKVHGHPEAKLDAVHKLRMSSSDARWLAGVFDCEGWLGSTESHKTFSVKAGIGMATPVLVSHVAKLTGLGKIMKRVIKNPRAKDQYHWVVWRAIEVKQLCKTMLPYLVLKAEQARTILQFPSLHVKNVRCRKVLHSRLRLLNKKGR